MPLNIAALKDFRHHLADRHSLACGKEMSPEPT
jgi:hypothetical protein